MKMFKNSMLLLLMTLLVVTCKEKDTSPTDITIYHSVSGIVFDVVSTDYSPGVKSGVPIVIDNETAYSNTEGRFVFYKISEGNHNISVSLPNYESYSKTISVMNDLETYIYLHGLKEDYFPIQENTQINFSYKSSSTNYVNTIEDKGIALWDIYSSKFVEDIHTYSVKETLIYTRTNNGISSTKQDTVFTLFEISENNSKIINVNSSVLDGAFFNRYMDPRLEQGGLIYKTYSNPGSVIANLTITLKKNVGIYSITQLGNRWSKTYQLVQ